MSTQGPALSATLQVGDLVPVSASHARVSNACRSFEAQLTNLTRPLYPFAPRHFCLLRPWTQFLDMPHNSCLVMWGGCQEMYKHGVPTMTKGVGIHPMAGERLYRCCFFGRNGCVDPVVELCVLMQKPRRAYSLPRKKLLRNYM